jgi:protease I
MATIILVIAKQDFQDYEFLETKRVLEQAHDKQVHTLRTASSTAGECKGRFGAVVKAELSCADALAALKQALSQPDAVHAVVFIGGGGALSLLDVPDALELARQAAKRRKVLAAICIAPVVLAKAGVLEGVKATVWDDGNGTQTRILKQGGATVLPQHIVVDGSIITADGPQAAKEFGRAIVKALQ